jgi:hypothetical protein
MCGANSTPHALRGIQLRSVQAPAESAGQVLTLPELANHLLEDAEDAFFVIFGAIGDVSGLAESFEILDPYGSVFWPHGKEFYDLD